MAEVSMTKEQLQELMANVIAVALKNANQMNPLEQKKYDEEIAKEKRRAKMVVALGKAEEEAQRAKKGSCSHCRWPANAGKKAGFAAPMGQGEWCTGGQKHGDMTISIICQRCSTEWRFKATAAEIEYADNEGLLGYAPPPPERLVSQCIDCSEYFTPAEMKEHECPRKLLLV